MKDEIRQKTPHALKNLGKEIFIEVPLYETKEQYRTVYVNEELFCEYFKDDNTNFAHMASVIEDYFSTTIDESKSNEIKIGNAYVDMQADPFKIALSGNLGSGRAFYQYDIFNIKGEKTPLATSPKPEYSNGVLELEKSIYETIASNSLWGDTNINLAPILAILDINEPCIVPWQEGPARRAKVVRVDLDGALNRITHIFKAKQALDEAELKNFAHKTGEMEGEKFLQRILHGAWSSGNISADAHMIDFDTVCSVKYRAPQYSFCYWYIDNYFGNEHIGQLKILKSLTKSKKINKDNLSYIALKKILLESRKNYIHKNFTKLMGFDKHYPQYDKEIAKLATKFMKLSTICFPELTGLCCKFLESQNCSPFDFSKFFRLYPILRHLEDWDEYKGLEYLINCKNEIENFNLADVPSEDEDDLWFNTHVHVDLDKFFIHSFSEFLNLTQKCSDFIKDYDKLYKKILNNRQENENKVQKRAYIVNQDRVHLIKPLSMAGPIVDEISNIEPEIIHKTIKNTILSNRRNGEIKLTDLHISNMEIYKEGYFATLLNDNFEHKLSLNLYKNCFIVKDIDIFEIKVNSDKYPCTIIKDAEIISIQSPFFDNSNLLPNIYDEIIFYKNKRKIMLNNFIFKFTESATISNFVKLFY